MFIFKVFSNEDCLFYCHYSVSYNFQSIGLVANYYKLSTLSVFFFEFVGKS